MRFSVFFLAKWHNFECWEQAKPPFLKLIFQLFVSTLFTCSLHSVEISGSTDVFKFCQYAFIIYNKLCVDISWPFHSQDLHVNSSVSITCGWYLPLFSFNTCSLDNVLILWRKNTYWSPTWGDQEQNMGTYILWTFLHFNIILSLGTNKNIFERLEMTGHSPARS